MYSVNMTPERNTQMEDCRSNWISMEATARQLHPGMRSSVNGQLNEGITMQIRYLPGNAIRNLVGKANPTNSSFTALKKRIFIFMKRPKLI